MLKSLGVFALGALAGAVAYALIVEPPEPEASYARPVVRDLVKPVALATAVAEKHREERYRDIVTVEDMLSLPTDFAQTEALYTIAGRSNSAQIQELIDQTSRVKERIDRVSGLLILFSRLVELDPKSAVAISRSTRFRGEPQIFFRVWSDWGRVDLDAAIDAARGVSAVERSTVAQALYDALRGQSPDGLERIERATGIAPDPQAIAARVAVIASERPEEAIAYVEGLRNPNVAEVATTALARQLITDFGTREASAYANLFETPAGKERFRRMMTSAQSIKDPEGALRAALELPKTANRINVVATAFTRLVQTSPESAEQWLTQVEDRDTRNIMMQVYAAAVANTDPQRAMDWIRSGVSEEDRSIGILLLGVVARNEPEEAMMFANELGDYQERSEAFSTVIATAAQIDAANAARLLDRYPDAPGRLNLVTSIANAWAQYDWQAAYDWLLQGDPSESQPALVRFGDMLASSNPDAALQVHNALPEEQARRLRGSIIDSMSAQGSFAEAEQFLRQYRDSAEYESLATQLAIKAAQEASDVSSRLARTISNPDLSDQILYYQLSTAAKSDPLSALERASEIQSQAMREQVTPMIIQQWHQTDPNDALQYALGLSEGAARDTSLRYLIPRYDPDSSEARRMLAAVSDPGTRQNMMVQQVMTLASSDPSRADQLLRTLDLSPEYKQQIQNMIDQGY
ncbi:MAG: hypothetical protein AAF578_01535 [Pseudomonadota bacterium]